MTKAKTSKGAAPGAKAKARADGSKSAKKTKAADSSAAPRLALAERLLLGLAHLTEIQRTAFRGQFSHAQCDELGARTQGEAVHREALEWAGVIDATLKKNAKAVRRYTEMRFAWLLECIRDLGEALETQRAAQGSAGVTRLRAQRLKAAAAAARDELLSVLEALAGGDKAEGEALTKAAGSGETPAAIARALEALAELAEDWLQRDTDAAKALVASVELKPGDVAAARAAADALTAAVVTGDKALEDRSAPRDLPTVNRAEGRVLLEMRLAMRLFDRASADSKLVPRLAPGAGTRRVLAPKRSSAPAA